MLTRFNPISIGSIPNFAKIDATYSDYNAPLNIQEPSTSQKIEEVLLPLITKQTISQDVATIGYYASLIYTDDKSYSSLCNHNLLNGYYPVYGTNLVTSNNNIISNGGVRPACFAGSQGYCVSTQLSDGSFMCVDGNGLGSVKCTSAQTVCSPFEGLQE